MIPKTVEGRRTRRQRYASAIDPLRKQFGCTAAEVPGRLNSFMESKEAKLQAAESKLEKAEAKIKELLLALENAKV